jgi:Catalytic LigB subunit of aromatic ring-opening dioxygenase
MAKIVAGIGMSHSSLVVTPEPEIWLAHQTIDKRHPHLRDRHGNPVTYEQLAAIQGVNWEKESSPEFLGVQIEQTIGAVGRLRRDLAELTPDVVIVFGDDQQELHTYDIPALAIYHGETIKMGTSMRFATYEEVLGDVSSMMQGYAMDSHHEFPGHAPLATHLISSLIDQSFDVAATKDVPADSEIGVGHAFGIMETNLLERPGAVPMIPVLVNTYWPPNQIPVPRSYDLGVAIRTAVESFPEDLRVAVVASGGLSHFTTDEVLDSRVLEACRAHDEAALRAIEPELLNGGSSEIRNWIATAAACKDLSVRWDEYIPVYRTNIGTGIGLAFALWA